MELNGTNYILMTPPHFVKVKFKKSFQMLKRERGERENESTCVSNNIHC